MTPLKIEATENTPFICLDKENQIFEISGNSYPEDSTAFYQPVLQWLSDYAKEPNEKTELKFNFIYFNSASYKSIYTIIYQLQEFSRNKGIQVQISWLYKEGDTDLMEVGEELATDVEIPFHLVPVNNE